eukprot:Em0003g1116a
MPTSQAAPNATALNAVTALSNPNSLLIHTIGRSKSSASGTLHFCCQCDVVLTPQFPMGSSQPTMCKLFPYWGTSFQCPMVHNLQPSTQYSFVEAACTPAGCQTGDVANVTTLDSGTTCGPSSPLILNTYSSFMSLQWNAPLQPDYVITAYTLHDQVSSLKSQSEMWAPPSTATVQFHTFNPSGIPFYPYREIGGQKDYAVFGHCVIQCP